MCEYDMKPALDLSIAQIPDFTHWIDAQKWIEQGLALIPVSRRMNQIQEESLVTLEWKDFSGISPSAQETLFGFFPSLNWRKFVLAVFFADLVSYPDPRNQVNFDRLLFILHSYPQGFRVYWSLFPDGSRWPVGYTGWYPMLESQFHLLAQDPQKMKSRMILPAVDDPILSKSFIYLFNFSVAKPFRMTSLSSALMKSYCWDLSQAQAQGLCLIAVSQHGEKMAERLGMSCTGWLGDGMRRDRVYIGA